MHLEGKWLGAWKVWVRVIEKETVICLARLPFSHHSLHFRWFQATSYCLLSSSFRQWRRGSKLLKVLLDLNEFDPTYSTISAFYSALGFEIWFNPVFIMMHVISSETLLLAFNLLFSSLSPCLKLIKHLINSTTTILITAQW